MTKTVKAPLSEDDVDSLKIGDRVLLSGLIYTARDQTHKRLIEAIKKSDTLPFPLRGQILFYAGPTPAPAGQSIGSIGPTTASRLDSYTPLLLERGLKGMIGKGNRGPAVKEAIKNNRAVYFLAVGGAAAYLAQYVEEAVVIAYKDLGPEAIYRLKVKDFPVIVAIDASGRDIFLEGPLKYAKLRSG